jgi:hypothetical protein
MNIVDNRLPEDDELVKTAPNFVLHMSGPACRAMADH